ncbi:MAG: hypothetical protein COC01_03755 [Bacteroidetes bacterium]|nr:MAG: hypothetical protein COC01_03755 [Bacteroidota bacterium]
MKKEICLLLFAITLTAVVWIGCNKDGDDITVDPDPTYGTLKVTFKGKVGSDEFVMYNEYTNSDNQVYRVEGLKYYFSNVVLVKSENTEEKIDSVALINFVNNHTAAGNTGESISFTVESGSYKGLKFYVGIDSTTNHVDPSLYASKHPLSSFNDTHWDWSQGFKFFMIDGKFDSDTSGTPNQSFSFHIGLDDYLKTIDFSDKSFTVSENNTSEYSIELDISKIFDSVDLLTNSFTHSTSNFDLVSKISTNYTNAMTKP